MPLGSVSTAIDSPQDLARARVALMHHLPAELRGPAAAVTLTAISAVAKPYERARMLRNLVPHLPSDLRGSVVAEALTAVTAIGGDHDWSHVLEDLVPHLPPDLLARVLDVTLALDMPLTVVPSPVGAARRTRGTTVIPPARPPRLVALPLDCRRWWRGGCERAVGVGP
ncbi:hypothetical protein [Frankia sp. CiP3]|uniref:hypothetical protein n=1 Tax=Frankia sp. CiP3 TaxID=2880971 RepID=UPI001EF4D2FD|nr:hypothetical protein [Frankia sp. CiP3]